MLPLFFLWAGVGTPCDDNLKALYVQAYQLRKNEGKHAEALTIYQDIFAQCRSPKAQGQIGFTLVTLEKWVEAEQALAEALRRGVGQDPWVDASVPNLQEALAKAQKNLTDIVIETDLPGAAIYLNDQFLGRSPLKPFRYPLGVYKVRAQVGARRVEKNLRVVADTRARVLLDGLRPHNLPDDDPQVKELQFRIKQALLRLKAGVPAQAEEQLKPMMYRPPGRTDPLLWLVMARAYYQMGQLQAAGQHLREAEVLGSEIYAEEPWVASFLEEFNGQVAQLQLISTAAGCRQAQLVVAKEAVWRKLRGRGQFVPRAEFEPVQVGWTNLLETQVLGIQVNIGESVYFPRGQYRMGTAGKTPQLVNLETALERRSVEDLGLPCYSQTVVQTVDPPAPEEVAVPTWVWWLIGGVAVVAGAAATTVYLMDRSPEAVDIRL